MTFSGKGDIVTLIIIVLFVFCIFYFNFFFFFLHVRTICTTVKKIIISHTISVIWLTTTVVLYLQWSFCIFLLLCMYCTWLSENEEHSFLISSWIWHQNTFVLLFQTDFLIKLSMNEPWTEICWFFFLNLVCVVNTPACICTVNVQTNTKIVYVWKFFIFKKMFDNFKHTATHKCGVLMFVVGF